nr:uncharacterized protein LOC128691338 isoform X2 [Cherax quadricarinatus]
MTLWHITTAVRIPAKVTPEALQPLPKTQKFVEVVLSGVSDAGVSHACDVVHKLQPPKGYYKITCVTSTLTEEGIQNMIVGLAERSVEVGAGLVVHTTVTLTKVQKDKLHSLAADVLYCYFKKTMEQYSSPD